MTNNLWMRFFLLGAGALALPAGFMGWRPIEVAIGQSAPPPSSEPVSSEPGSLDSLGQAVVNRNPFRLTRSPAEVAYSPLPAETVSPEPQPPKPVLMLTGIVWGAEPGAIVEGFPGIEGGRLLRTAEETGGIRVTRITAEAVTLKGMDTTWTLRVRKPW